MADITWAPTVADIAAELPRRPAITDSSRPSAAQVQSIIDNMTANVSAELANTPIKAALFGKAKYVATLGAAARVEMKFWPEQYQQGDSDGQLLWGVYQSELLGLRRLAGDSVGAAGGSSAGALISVELVTPTTFYPPVDLTANLPTP